MKIIFSRKGVDSQAGKLSSAIINDRLLSIPIPAGKWDKSKTKYRDLTLGGIRLSRLVEDLSSSRPRTDRRRGDEFVHFDPDLRRNSLKRKPGWRPLLGLGSKQVSRLARNGVNEGDIFLFFGPFRPVQKDLEGRYRYTSEPKRHIIHGWLQIGRILEAGPLHRKNVPEWMRYHPHFLNEWGESNTVYVSKRRLQVSGLSSVVPGGGSFARWSPKLCLTAPDSLMSRWRLPFVVRAHNGRYPMSRFENKGWSHGKDCSFLNTNIGYWQDEVLDASKCEGVVDWLVGLFR